MLRASSRCCRILGFVVSERRWSRQIDTRGLEATPVSKNRNTGLGEIILEPKSTLAENSFTDYSRFLDFPKRGFGVKVAIPAFSFRPIFARGEGGGHGARKQELFFGPAPREIGILSSTTGNHGEE